MISMICEFISFKRLCSLGTMPCLHSLLYGVCCSFHNLIFSASYVGNFFVYNFLLSIINLLFVIVAVAFCYFEVFFIILYFRSINIKGKPGKVN
jgi:hypothetical protein